MDIICKRCGETLFTTEFAGGAFFHTRTGCVSCYAVEDGDGGYVEPYAADPCMGGKDCTCTGATQHYLRLVEELKS